MNEPIQPKYYSTPVTVEFEDVDSFQIAHHTKIVAYLERARVRYFHDKGVQVVGGSALPVLYHLDIKFKKTVTIMDVLDIQVWVAKAETYKLTLAYNLLRKGELIAKASTVIAFIDAKTQKLTLFRPHFAKNSQHQIVSPLPKLNRSQRDFTQRSCFDE